MRSSHVNAMAATTSAVERLSQFLEERRTTAVPVEDWDLFEERTRALFAEAEAECVGRELALLDVKAPVILIDGIAHRFVLRCEEEYFTAAGPVRVERNLYSTREEGERAVCPMELRAGIIEGRWTRMAARQATWVVAHLTPQEGEDLFGKLGRMTPSKSTLDRLPKQLSERWEGDRVRFEEQLRVQEEVPAEAVSMAVSLDGVLVPMKGTQRKQTREQAQAEEKYTRGPAGYREVGVATVSFYDREGERLKTVRYGRMPQHKKATLKAMLTAEALTWLAARPDLVLTKLADGAKDNWEYLTSDALPAGTQVVDYYHAAEHLQTALAAAYGDTSTKCRAQSHKLRHVLLEEHDGVEKIIRALRHLRAMHPRSRVLPRELKYFRANRHRMRYAELKAQKLPVGSGVTEAACKTLATQRLKRSGMHWGEDGGQAVLTFRALAQSERFERGWKLLAATYKARVSVPDNVIAFSACKSR